MCGERGNIILWTLPPQSDTLGRVKKKKQYTRVYILYIAIKVYVF